MSADPQRIDVSVPCPCEETEDSDGNKVATKTDHLMSDEQGEFPIGSLNNWETSVLESEMGQPGFRPVPQSRTCLRRLARHRLQGR